jgi:tetratricopeptide (TPR) repeat protein
MPDKESWTIMLYKDLTLGGNVAEYKPENEVLRFKVKPTTLGNKVETFTIGIADITPGTADIEILWDRTRVAIHVTTDIDTKVMKNIETALSPDDKRPYFQAASYYYETDKDLNKAMAWVNKAIEQNPKAFYVVHLKAKIQVKQKDFKGAIATAEQSIVLSKEAKNDDYVKLNEKLIAEAKKGK